MSETFSLAKLSQATELLAACMTVEEAKPILEMAEAARHYAKVSGLGLEATNLACEIKLRAERRIGELRRAPEASKAGRPFKNNSVGGNTIVSPPTLADMGITAHQSSRFKAIAAIPEPVFEAHIVETKAKSQELTSAGLLRVSTQRKRADKEAKREQRRQENAIKAAMATDPITVGAHFATILIDPPWDWGDEGDVNQMGRAKPDYATMTIEQLLDLPVGKLSDDDCHLYLWITNRSLPKGFALFEAWGFRYVTCLTWVKPHFGMGNYFRGQTEHILFGVKGSQPLLRHDVGTVFHADRGPNGHSSKPPMIYELIESCSPGPYLEMFSRTQRDTWHRWGADAK